MNEPLTLALHLLAEGKHLPRELAERVFQIIMNGGATPAHMAAILMGLRINGETVEEITAGASVLRAKSPAIKVPVGAIDTCGTGGDGRHSYNISTATAIVLAACGIPVVKHGNRSVSSKSGSADVLETLGVKMDADIATLEHCLAECNIAFLFAPKFHPAMRHVSPIRQELGLRTIFNMIGPLANPARPDFQLLGVYDKAWIVPMAEALRSLGTKAAWVVHGHDGLDELTLTGTTFVAELRGGTIRTFDLTPQEAGLPTAMLEDLRGGDAAHNARALEHALSGMESAHKNAVLYNTAAGLLIAGQVSNLPDGVAKARHAIDSGEAFRTLKKWVLTSNASIR